MQCRLIKVSGIIISKVLDRWGGGRGGVLPKLPTTPNVTDRCMYNNWVIHLGFFIYYYYYYYRTYVGVCVTPPFFFFGVRCAQYKVHAPSSFAALAPHMPCMLLVNLCLFCSQVLTELHAGYKKSDMLVAVHHV